MSYSQHEEERFVLDFFKGTTSGYLLDIGCGDGVNGSNTRALWETGWTGVFIDANLKAFSQLLNVYGNNNRALLIYAAVCERLGPVVFYDHPESGWSGLQPCLGETRDYQPKMVMGITLASLHLPWSIDFLSIDTEGKDADILETMPPNMRPKLILAECDKPKASERFQSFLPGWGYKVVWTNNANVAYARAPGH